MIRIWKKVVFIGLKKIAGDKNLGTELFEQIIKVVPQTAIEALVVDNIDNPRKVLLTWRQDKNYFGWHIPGGYIRFGEMPEDRLKRVIRKELGVLVRKYKDTCLNHTLIDSRGHTIGLIYLVELENTRTIDGTWFDKIPTPIIERHKEIITDVLKFS